MQDILEQIDYQIVRKLSVFNPEIDIDVLLQYSVSECLSVKEHTYILRKCVELAINIPPQNIYY